MDEVMLVNRGTRGSVDIDIPGTGRPREAVVTRSKVGPKGVGREVVKQIVSITARDSRTLAPGERIRLPLSVLDDPVIASRIRAGVLGVSVVPARTPSPRALKRQADAEKKGKKATGKQPASGKGDDAGKGAAPDSEKK